MAWRYILVRNYTPLHHRLVPLTAALVGFVYGAFQAYARAFYAELIPRGEEAKWYALYSITDKVRNSVFSVGVEPH
jgi:MFS-type transporter involved in bile tolerance (Atg22 family)